MVRACFVTATDTGVGKTVVAAAIVAGLRADGLDVRARKPVLTGVPADGRGAAPVSADTDLSGLADDAFLAAVSGERSDDVSSVRYEPPVSPHLAAQLAGRALEIEPIVASLRTLAEAGEGVVVEGIGGLLVPFNDEWDVRRLARALGWPVIVVARCGVGTLNHTLLTLEAARSAGLDVRAVVLTPWPDPPSVIEESNRDTIARRGSVEVATLPALSPLSCATLTAAARALPYERWLAG